MEDGGPASTTSKVCAVTASWYKLYSYSLHFVIIASTLSLQIWTVGKTDWQAPHRYALTWPQSICKWSAEADHQWDFYLTSEVKRPLSTTPRFGFDALVLEKRKNRIFCTHRIPYLDERKDQCKSLWTLIDSKSKTELASCIGSPFETQIGQFDAKYRVTASSYYFLVEDLAVSYNANLLVLDGCRQFPTELAKVSILKNWKLVIMMCFPGFF